jgi:peroxiredoxin
MKYLISKSSRKTVIIAPVALAMLFLLLFMWSPYASAGGIKVGEPTPIFVLTNSDGKQVNMGSLLDKPAVIYFTHNACHYCTQIIEHLKRAEAKFGRQNLRIFGINVMAKDEKLVKAYKEELGFIFPMLAGNRWDVLKAYKIAYVPVLVFVDANKITRKVVGHYIHEPELHENIKEIMEQ